MSSLKLKWREAMARIIGESMAEVSAIFPDWPREQMVAWSWDPARALLRCIRDYQNAKGPFAPKVRKYAVFRHRFWSVATGADIPINSRIGGGLLIPRPNGMVVHPRAQIGCNCLLFQQVMVGATEKGAPTIGGHVDVGAGAKTIGPVTIGDHVRIGANAVVREDVLAYGTFVANPGALLNLV